MLTQKRADLYRKRHDIGCFGLIQEVGNLSAKDSRLAPVFRWQSVSKPVRNTNCPIESDCNRLF
ncbi:MAG: hypothetical protein LBG58_05980 [Planctomycetaceae bacterium]|nr:hypothetical protein [Planctomycetaceae bacterium]